VKEFVGLLLFGDDHVVFFADAGEMFFFEVAQAFAFDGSGDAGAEKDGIERFWEVILGAHFNAADGIAGVLATGDDDDGRGGLGMFSDFVEHLESVDLWHFDVEQHEVIVCFCEALERFSAIFGFGHGLESELFKGTNDPNAHHFAVVDHEDFCVVNGFGGRAPRGNIPLAVHEVQRVVAVVSEWVFFSGRWLEGGFSG
jgi:hypothetical protein